MLRCPVLNFPGMFTAPYIAATSPEDSNPITVSVSGHFRRQSNLDVVTFQEDGTLNLLEHNGKGSFTLAERDPRRGETAGRVDDLFASNFLPLYPMLQVTFFMALILGTGH
jgi:hypothetical protein